MTTSLPTQGASRRLRRPILGGVIGGTAAYFLFASVVAMAAVATLDGSDAEIAGRLLIAVIMGPFIGLLGLVMLAGFLFLIPTIAVGIAGSLLVPRVSMHPAAFALIGAIVGLLAAAAFWTLTDYDSPASTGVLAVGGLLVGAFSGVLVRAAGGVSA